MSSRPGSDLYSPQPVDFAITGTTDANGNFMATKIIRQAYWCAVKLVGQATGNPQWTVYKSDTSIPIDFGLGPNVSIGPFLVAPNQNVLVKVAGALPNMPVTVNLTGVQAANLADITTHFSPQSSFVTVGALGSVPVDFNPVRFTSAAVLSGATVVPVADTSIFAPDQAVDIQPGGTHLVQSVQPGTSVTLLTGVTANIPAGSPIMRVGIVGIFAQPIAVTFNPANSGTNKVTPAAFQQAQFSADMATNSFASGADILLVSGIVGQTIYIWGIHVGFSIIDGNVRLQDSLGNVYWRGTFQNGPGTNSVFESNLFGVQVPNDGRNLNMHNGAASSIGIFGSVFYSQG